MAAMQTQILQDGFDGLTNNLSFIPANNRAQQMNGVPTSANNNTVINIQSPGYIQEKSPTPRVININSGSMQQPDGQNPRSG